MVRLGTLTIGQERRKTENNNGEMFCFISFSLLVHLEVLTKNTVSTHSYLINTTMSDRSIKQDKRKEKGQNNMVDFTEIKFKPLNKQTMMPFTHKSDI